MNYITADYIVDFINGEHEYSYNIETKITVDKDEYFIEFVEGPKSVCYRIEKEEVEKWIKIGSNPNYKFF